MKKLAIMLVVLGGLFLSSCEKEPAIHPLVGWWEVQNYEITYFASLPKTTEGIVLVEFVDCVENVMQLYFDESGTGRVCSEGQLEYNFNWTTTGGNLSVNKFIYNSGDTDGSKLNYTFQITGDLFRYTNEGVSLPGYWTCVNTAVRIN